MNRIAVAMACAMLTSIAHAQTDFRNALRVGLPSVVQIDASQPGAENVDERFQIQINGQAMRLNAPNGMMGADTGMRVGFAVGADLVMTQLPDRVDEVTLRTGDNQERDAKVISRDVVTGIAVLRVPDTQMISLVVGVGNPEAGLPVVVPVSNGKRLVATTGMIASQLSSEHPAFGFTQSLDGNITGNSIGGPIFDSEGVVVGVVGLTDLGSVCCLSTSQAQRLIDAAANDEILELRRGMIGIQFDSEADAGVIDVSPDSPAAKAGIQVGDKVVAVGQYDIRMGDDVVAGVSMYRAGDKVPVKVERDGELVKLELELIEHPRQKLARRIPDWQMPPMQAFRLPDGGLAPMGVLPPNAPGMDRMMPEILRQLDDGELLDGQFIVPEFKGRLEGFQIDRDELKKSLEQMEQEKESQADEIEQLKQRLKDLQKDLPDNE